MKHAATPDLFAPAAPTHDPGGKSKPQWRKGSVVTARFSDDQLYRYALTETWDASRPAVMWLMMNPSVANMEHADPTLIRTGTFSRAWGYGTQIIVNVHAYRATDSDALVMADDPVGPENDAAILAMTDRADIVVLAYGQPPKALRARAGAVVAMLRAAGAKLRFLRLAQDGTPMHPLYLSGSLVPLEYESPPVPPAPIDRPPSRVPPNVPQAPRQAAPDRAALRAAYDAACAEAGRLYVPNQKPADWCAAVERAEQAWRALRGAK